MKKLCVLKPEIYSVVDYNNDKTLFKCQDEFHNENDLFNLPQKCGKALGSYSI